MLIKQFLQSLCIVAFLHGCFCYDPYDLNDIIIRNATMIEGAFGEMPCTFGLPNQKVIWTRNRDRASLMDETRFTHRNPVWAPEWWEMKIHDVQKSDEGYYTCQKESDPEIKKVIYLRVIENGIAPRFWRLDSQCGEGVMNPSYPGGPEWATCDPEGVYPCCSDAGWCGITPNHCTCNGCIDYRH